MLKWRKSFARIQLKRNLSNFGYFCHLKVLVSPGLEGRRLRSSPRLRLVAKSGTLNVISEHLTWWNPLSFNNAIRNTHAAWPALLHCLSLVGLDYPAGSGSSTMLLRIFPSVVDLGPNWIHIQQHSISNTDADPRSYKKRQKADTDRQKFTLFSVELSSYQYNIIFI